MLRDPELEIDFGKRLRQYRREANYSVEEVAEILREKAIPYTSKAIYKWESNKVRPNIGIVKTLCDIYNRDIDGLFCDNSFEKETLSEKESVLIDLYRGSMVVRNFLNDALIHPSMDGNLDLKTTSIFKRND